MVLSTLILHVTVVLVLGRLYEHSLQGVRDHTKVLEPEET